MSFMCLLALSHCDVCSALSARSVRSGSTRRSCETPVTGSCCCGSRVWMAPSRTRSTRFSLQTFLVGWPARIILPPLHTRLRTRSHNDLRTQTTHMYRHAREAGRESGTAPVLYLTNMVGRHPWIDSANHFCAPQIRSACTRLCVCASGVTLRVRYLNAR